MGKNDFDIDFDFEKEYGFDPKSFLGDEEYDENMGLSEFSDEELGLKTQPSQSSDADSAALGEDPVSDFDLDVDLDLDDFLNLGNKDENHDVGEDFTGDADLADELDLSGVEDADFPETEEWDDTELPEDAESEEIEMSSNTEYPEEADVNGQAEFEDEPVDETTNKVRKPRPQKERKPKKPAGPNIFTKFYDLYFAPLLSKNTPDDPPDPNNPRRRRKKSKAQIFKEVYLPPIIACVCLILVLSFAIGSLSNFIEQRRINKDIEQSRVNESKSAESQMEEEYQRIMNSAAVLAAGYNYEDAITTLDSFSGDLKDYPEMTTRRAEYVTAQSQLVEFNNPSAIKNLSFHVLMADPARALADTGEGGLAGSYNKNFVSTTEFSKILNDLYNNGYVLVDFDSFTAINNDVVLSKSIYLPEGKTPFMITETMVNYFDYMIDGNGDGVADASGKGFASKLVLDSNGDIKAEYVDANGATLVGDYDLVPILESFIKEHPDFSYQGARATVAVCGYEGIFGYRINSSYAASKGSTYQEEQIAGAKTIVQALRDKGYTLACYTYGNENYGNINANQITADLQSWTSQIVPVIGEVNTFVFARESNISEYGTGTAFNVMYTSGFRYFVSNGSEPWAEIKSNYVRQNRLMVTGKNMAYNSSWFNGMFDCAAILDVNLRGTVPNS